MMASLARLLPLWLVPVSVPLVTTGTTGPRRGNFLVTRKFGAMWKFRRRIRALELHDAPIFRAISNFVSDIYG
jgi:hypothetical protein